MVAKTAAAQTDLVRQLGGARVRREYLALAHGDDRARDHVDAPIGRHPVARTSMAVVASGKPARHARRRRSSASASRRCCAAGSRPVARTRSACTSRRSAIRWSATRRTARAARRGGVLAFPRQALHARRLGYAPDDGPHAARGRAAAGRLRGAARHAARHAEQHAAMTRDVADARTCAQRRARSSRAQRCSRGRAGVDWIVAATGSCRRRCTTVHAFVTTRDGGVSAPPYDTLNLGIGAGDGPRDDAAAVAENRRRVARTCRQSRCGCSRCTAPTSSRSTRVDQRVPRADAAVTRSADRPLVVLVADCLPVLFATATAAWSRSRMPAGAASRRRARAHARGDGRRPATICAWLGPAIGPARLRGRRRRARRVRHAATPRAADAFRRDAAGQVARRPLRARAAPSARAGVAHDRRRRRLHRSDPARFYSYRRDGATRTHGRLHLDRHDAQSARRAA